MAERILFVCLGNICRSPAAEAILRLACPGAHIDSAGTASYHIGEPPYSPMREAASRRGYDMSDLRARQFEVGDFDRFDRILVMDRENRRDVLSLRPQGNSTPVDLFATYAEGAGQSEIADPYYTREFDSCLDLLEAAAQGLKRTLRSTGG